MLDTQGVIQFLNNKSDNVANEFIARWRGIYYGMSLHISGAAPRFKDLAGRGWITPVNYYGEAYQQLFEIFLLNRHPREADVTKDWRFSQYRAITKSPLLKAMGAITGAFFQDSNYNIQLEDPIDNEYIWGNNFNGKTLANYFESKFQAICEDPNGFFVRIPSEPYYATTTERIEPKIIFINSINILRIEDDEILFWGQDYVWQVNNIGYFRYDKNDNGDYYHVDEQYGGYYAHLLGYLPIDQAGGQWNEKGFFESWLNDVKPIVDDFISNKSASQMVDKEASHPYIIEVSTDCPTCNAVGKVFEDIDESDPHYAEYIGGRREVICTMCQGSGQVSRNPADRLIAPAADMARNLVQIVNPDIAINQYHKDNLAELEKTIYKALYLDSIDEAQSGVAKNIDLQARKKFYVKICNDLFDRLIGNTMRDIVALRNATVSNGMLRPMQDVEKQITIIKPTDFDIKSPQDLLNEYDISTKALTPDFIRARQINDYVDKQFGGDAVMKRKSQIITQMDFMCVKSDADKQALVLGGGATTRDWQFSTQLPFILDGLIRNNSSNWFIISPYDLIKVAVDEQFAIIEPITQTIPPPTTIQERVTQ